MLTIGMATFEDFDGCYFSIQDIRLHHLPNLGPVELIIIDNSPGTKHGEYLRNLVVRLKAGGDFAAVQYFAIEGQSGTSATRQMIFDKAAGDYVVCMDCHVLFPPGSLWCLEAYYADNPGCNDIISGPMLQDPLDTISTHFADSWGAGMWGQWGTAYQCGCGPDGTMFDLTHQAGHAQARSLELGPVPLTQCLHCGQPLPGQEPLPWPGHEQVLATKGYRRLGWDDNDPAFAIPGMGLGVFSCRKAAWLGFNPDSYGFGGEELYIHEKFRQAGYKALCLPGFKWLHRFGRVHGHRYALLNYHKARNYVLEFNELGRSLDEVYAAFIPTALVPEWMWDELVANPKGQRDEPVDPNAPKKPGCNTCGDTMELAETPDGVFDQIAAIPRDMDQHMVMLRKYAALCTTAAEVSGRRESTIAILAGGVEKLISHNPEAGRDAYVKHLQLLTGCEVDQTPLPSQDVTAMQPTELLFINTEHTYDRVLDELTRFGTQTTRFIALHNTHIFRFQGQDGGKGLIDAMRVFMQANPQWSVLEHTIEEYGFTVLGCQKQDKPSLPGIITMAKNFTVAVAGHVASGMEHTSQGELVERLNACTMCDHRTDANCSVCGCVVAEKAKMRDQDCPLMLWPQLPIIEPEGGAA